MNAHSASPLLINAVFDPHNNKLPLNLIQRLHAKNENLAWHVKPMRGKPHRGLVTAHTQQIQPVKPD